MKIPPFVLCLCLIVFNGFAQQEGTTGNFIHLSQVQKAPSSEDCVMDLPICTAIVLQEFINKNISFVGPLTSQNSEKTEVMAKVIIDTLGQISWASVKGLPTETGNKLAKRLKEMSVFIPGEHEGQKVNVIVDVIVPFLIWEAENFSSEVAEKPKISPAWHRCEQTEADKKCTSEALMEYILKKVNTRKLKQPSINLSTSFVVGEDGNVKRIVVHGNGDVLGQEVIKQLKKLPAMKPGRKDGKAVATSLSMTVRTQIH